MVLLMLLACAAESRPPPPDLTIPADVPVWSRLNGLLATPGEYGEKDWDDVRMRAIQHLATIGRDRARIRAIASDPAGCAALYLETAKETRGIRTAGDVGLAIRDTLVGALERDAGRCLDDGRALGAPPPVDLSAFDDFTDRHRLRVELVKAWAKTVSATRPSDPWGYWGEAPRVSFTAEGLGALPTGDSYVDVAGFPGPKGIGKLAKLSLDDPAHRAWLERKTAELNAAADVPAAIAAMVAELDAHPFGSRYYNIKQARNEGVRVLANRTDYAGALEILRASWPLHAQDWACPNREGILRGLEGRLLLLKGDYDEADRVLQEARKATLAFVRHTEERERLGPPPAPRRP